MLLASVYFQACRSVYREGMSADSSSVRSEDNTEKYSRETIREYYPGLRDTVSTHTIEQIQVPIYIRERIRETGEKKQKVNEQTQVAVQETKVDKTAQSPWIYIAAGCGGMFLLMIMLIIAYKVIKSRILSAIPKAVTANQ